MHHKKRALSIRKGARISPDNPDPSSHALMCESFGKLHLTDRIGKSFSFQTFRIVLPAFCLIWLFIWLWDGFLFEATTDLLLHRWILFVIEWCVAVLIVLILAAVLRLFKTRLSPTCAAILIILFQLDLDGIGHTLADNWTLASGVTYLYGAILGQEPIFQTLTFDDIVSNLGIGLLQALPLLGIIL